MQVQVVVDAPERVAPLLARKQGTDLLHDWPASRIAVPGPFPAFPVVDADAIVHPAKVLFYQVAGRCADGTCGDSNGAPS